MATIDVDLIEESETRYLTYALSVVSSRALPDVRDGLKPVQRRILFAMYRNLRLLPDKAHRKSAAVVGEVLARYHPHGDSACYEAMVRMAQDFSLRYPLVDGQGNFGSLDGDSAAAYRYTEAKLTQLALEVLGDIEQETVAERDNFDQTVKEPVVLPARIPNLLINGASGIAVGMATAIPPHNLKEVVDALLMLLENPEAKDAQLIGKVKGPDFPTGCSILNTVSELREIYTSGRGAIRMRADYGIEKGQRGKNFIVISSVPYGVDKSAIVEKIADLIIAKKIPQLTDVRDESTEIVRVVLELAPEANAEIAMAYLYKHTPLEHSFHVNLTALVPTSNPLSGRPTRLSLREMLQQFLDFRLKVTRAKLEFEKAELEKRIHLLEGLALVLPSIEEVIKIVRKSDGRADSAAKLQKRFTLSELQAFYIVDLRIYQLSKTNIDEVLGELQEKQDRVKAINKLLKSEAALKGEIATDLKRVSETYGDKRRSKILHDFEEVTIDEQQFVQHEDVYALVTKDGWLKRIRQNNDPAGTRLREGDSLMFTAPCSTKDFMALFSSAGNVYVGRVAELSSTSGYGEPVQKLYKFDDGESIVGCLIIKAESSDMFEKDREIVLVTKRGFGFRLKQSFLEATNKNGRRLVRVKDGDALVGVCELSGKLLAIISREGYGVQLELKDVPLLAQAGKGVTLQKLPTNDPVIGFICGGKDKKFEVELEKGGTRPLTIGEVVQSARARRGNKVIQRGGPLTRIVA